jgi:hypothetical protein
MLDPPRPLLVPVCHPAGAGLAVGTEEALS